MAEIINLNKFKKNQNRKFKEHQAKTNRVKFGQTKVEKIHKEYQAHHRDKELTEKKIDSNDTDLS